ncbi:MAG: hypothetical protein P8100_14420, partial [bacterium]
MSFTRRISAGIFIIMLSFGLYAQSIDDVGAKLNEGNEAMKAKQYAKAITAYEAAIKMSGTVGAEADALKESSQQQLVNAYYRNGITLYKSKNYESSVANLNNGRKLAGEIGDTDMENKLTVVTAKVLSSKGMSLIKDNDLDGAYQAFDEAHQVKANCVISYYGKGLVWKERGDFNKMMASMDKAIELGEKEPKMGKYVERSKDAASKALLAEATEEINKEHGEEAAQH